MSEQPAVQALTWEQYEAGAPCPGCGRLYRDGSDWEFPGTQNMTPEQRSLYDAEEAEYRSRHGDCKAGQHRVSGSLTAHCLRCCPPPPLSPEQRENMARILRAMR